MILDNDDDCLNKSLNPPSKRTKSANVYKSSMNRIDNTHATFINCLRDWNDPFLHGHKPVKALGCQRCENSNCRYTNNNNTSANSANTSNNYSSSSSITSSNQVNSTINNANSEGTVE